MTPIVNLVEAPGEAGERADPPFARPRAVDQAMRRYPLVSVIVGVTVILAVSAVVVNSRNGVIGFDFRGSVWAAGGDVLAGTDPYPPADPAHLLLRGNGYVYPPVLAVLAAPLSLLPLTAAFAVWTLVNAFCVVLALRLVGVKDARLLVFVVATFPVVDALILGQPDGVFALLLALVWRYRDQKETVSGASCGLLVAAKLLAWPLFVFLLATRRWKAALTAGPVALFAILGSWAVIDFRGLGNYPHLLAADAAAFQNRSHSIVGLIQHLGGGTELGRAIAGLAALVLLGMSWRAIRSQGDELSGLAMALLAGLALSPIVHSHYLGVLLIPLAVGYPRFGAPWLVLATLWLSPTEGHVAHTWQVFVPWLVALSLIVAIRARPDLRRNTWPLEIPLRPFRTTRELASSSRTQTSAAR